ncbi:adenylyl-sulfate kinase [Robertkochia aurantiaca]|uniref:adenylyl-sulfate kinase n=1 Tax=Robertkochia aurantiaca TaxID=2873700 RepID=UPI001CD0137E|nr:adenylyl-sulfate kinase [Robertkochia sp. 3YJGBD-33]
MSKNIVEHRFKVVKSDRNRSNGHASFLVWFTGLSGSGKSTVANIVEQRLHERGIKTYVLDGDNVRTGLNKDLSFNPEDRSENIRRIGEVSKLMIDAGLVVLAAFVSPYKNDREMIAKTVDHDNFVEIFVNTSLEECEKRDVKGLYKKARAGEIKNLTGVNAPYEKPANPDLEITEKDSLEHAADKVLEVINKRL